MSRALFLLTFVLAAKAFVIEEIRPRRRVTAKIGEELELVCRTRGCASPSFVWSTLLDNPLGGTVRPEGNSSILSMKVGFVNENDYRCTAFCGEEKKQRTVKVNIYSFPSDPVIETSSPLELGKPAMITCTVPNVYPSDRLEISLKKEGKSLGSKDFSQDPFTKSLQTKSVTFPFIPAEEDIGKTITCVAELSIEMSEQKETTRTLNVTYAPRFLNFAMLPSAAVQEGESVTLQCSANSSPTARFVIKKKLTQKDEVLESQNGSVHILKVTPDDAGEYECEAENEFGNVKATATLSVTFQPRNTTIITSSSNSVKEGEAVTMICSSYGNPLPSISWKKQLENGTSRFITKDATFILKDVRAEDEGHYECEAVNSAGKETKAVELIVQVLPPTTPALTDQPETTTELVDFTTESTSYTTEPQEDSDDETHTEDEHLPFTKTTTITAPKNDTVTSPEKMFDVINPTEEMKVVIARIEEPDYMIPVIIVASTLATAAGPITAALIYACRRSKANGSYSPVSSEV